MQPKPSKKSFTKYISLETKSGVDLYCDIYTKILNNSFKYKINNLDITLDNNNCPYCVVNYIEDTSEKDSNNKKIGFNISGDILSIDELEEYDKIIELISENKAYMIYQQDLFIKNFIEKTNEFYRLFIYYSRKDGEPFGENDVKINSSDSKRKS